tara:strand:+ start:1337 stop:1612 length:276 start_codon:yes stop_codon:yes gene_type:complete
MNLEDTINELESDFKEVSKMKFGLLSATLEPFDFLYQDVNGQKTYEVMEKSQKDSILSSLKNDLLPLFEENKFDEGIEKIKNIIKDLEERN